MQKHDYLQKYGIKYYEDWEQYWPEIRTKPNKKLIFKQVFGALRRRGKKEFWDTEKEELSVLEGQSFEQSSIIIF